MTGALPALSPVPVVLDEVPVQIDRDEVLRFQGYKRGVDVPTEEVLGLFDEAVVLCERLMAPRVVYRSVPARLLPQLIEVEGERLRIPEIGRLWGRIDAVGAGICTIGDATELRVGALFESRELPLAVMLDSVASVAVESLAEYANGLVCQAALGEGLKAANRISPGYAGWDVADQAALFRLCPGGPIGVALNQACFMTPTKSLSFLVGLGPEARVDSFTQCRRCWMRECAYRRASASGSVRR